MKMIRFDLPSEAPVEAVVLGIGVFDGVHRGHRRIISELAAMGRRTGALPVAVTFLPHPREVLGRPPLPRLLMPPELRMRRLREAGAAGIGIIDFSREIAETPPPKFVEALLATRPTVRGVCVGSHWRFGHLGSGDATFLAAELERRGIAFRAVPELHAGARIVSSSIIREAIASGDLAGARAMLGSRPALYGTVESGHRVAGRLLHAPTANLHVEFGVLPPDGVYASCAVVDGDSFPAVTNIGLSPTFGDTGERRVETHLIGFSDRLYDRKITVELIAKLRDEKRFASPEKLAEQIRTDMDNALKALTGEVDK